MANEVVTLSDKAAAEIKAQTEAGAVDAAVVSALVKERIDRRTELLLGAVKDRANKVKALGKIKPADKGYQEDGTVIPGDSYTLAQVERIKLLKKQIEEVDAAIAARDFDKLSKLGY